MSDVPPPPPFHGTPPPPPPPPPPPGQGAPGGYGVPSGYGTAPGYARVKGPRPNVAVGGWLIIVGSALSIIGVFLPWVNGRDSITGLDDFLTTDFTIVESPGIASIMGGLIAIGLGIALIAAGRVLAVAIIAVVVASFGLLTGLGFMAIASDTASWGDESMGIGVFMQPVGAAIALTGAIMALAKRRPMLNPY